MFLTPTIRKFLQHPLLLYRQRPSLLRFHLVFPPVEETSVLDFVFIGQMMMLIYVCLQRLVVREPLFIILHTPSSCNLPSKSIILPRRYRPYSSSSCTLSHPMLRAFKFLRPVWLMGLSNFSAYSFATPVT